MLAKRCAVVGALSGGQFRVVAASSAAAFNASNVTSTSTSTSTITITTTTTTRALSTAGLFAGSPLLAQSTKAVAGTGSSSNGNGDKKRGGSKSPAQATATATTTTASCDSPRNETTMLAGPYRRVGNVFVVSCEDHPFKHGWEVNRMLRDLRIEFRGQTVIHPDIPDVRKRLWRVRHLVRIDIMDLDEAKALVGVPAHMNFSELNAQIPATFGRGGGVSSPSIRSKVRFMRLRRMRLRDVLHRDELEKRLLEEKRRAMTGGGKAAAAAGTV